MATTAITHHDRTVGAILDAAGQVLAARGAGASMADVAQAAGVGRATLYRHFDSRESLLAALSARAVDDAAKQLEAAHLDRVPFDEAVERIARAIVAVGDRYAVLVREQFSANPADVEKHVREPMRAVFRRGQREGVVRADIPLESIVVLFRGALEAAVRLAETQGVEDAAAAVTAVFLDGVRS